MGNLRRGSCNLGMDMDIHMDKGMDIHTGKDSSCLSGRDSNMDRMGKDNSIDRTADMRTDFCNPYLSCSQ